MIPRLQCKRHGIRDLAQIAVFTYRLSPQDAAALHESSKRDIEKARCLVDNYRIVGPQRVQSGQSYPRS